MDLTLTKDERESPLWERLVEHHEKRLAVLRAKNDASLDAEETASLRGQIKEVKVFLALGIEEPEFEKKKQR